VLDEGIEKGLLEEIIAREMMITTYFLPTNLEETDVCIICQV